MPDRPTTGDLATSYVTTDVRLAEYLIAFGHTVDVTRVAPRFCSFTFPQSLKFDTDVAVSVELHRRGLLGMSGDRHRRR